MHIQDLAEFAADSMRGYAREVVCNRAIPDYRDGLKPVQRAILWQMRLSGLTPTAKHMKLAKLSGLCMTFHPHGDGAIDAAAMTMSQAWSRRTPLVEIHGNNGAIDGSRGAASRYVEARMTPTAELLFDGVDENAVDIVDNYDNTAKIADVLPAEYPVMFANGSSGIGFGLATSILPHNPAELISLMLLELKGELTPAVAAKVYSGPDFPTGGFITGDPAAELTSSRATYRVYADVSVEQRRVVVRGVPFGVSSTDMIDSIAVLIESLALPYVTDVIDLTENNSVLVHVECKRGTDPANLNALADVIRQRSKASASVSASNICVMNGRPKAVNVIEYIKAFTRFRLDTLQRVYRYRLDRVKARIPIVDCELFAAYHLDQIKPLIDQAANEQQLIELLHTGTHMTCEQAKHIAGMRLSSLIRQGKHVAKLQREREELDKAAAQYSLLLSSPEAATGALVERLKQLHEQLSKQFPRQSRFVAARTLESDKSVSAVAAAAASEPVVIETDGTTVHVRKRASDDSDLLRLECMSDEFILMFTDHGRLLRLQPGVLPLDDDGRIAVAGFKHDEHIIHLCRFDKRLKVISVTRHGYVKNSPITKCLPRKITNANQQKLHVFNSCSGARVRAAGLTDRVVYIRVHAPGQGPNDLTLQQPAKPRRKETVIDGRWLNDRSDGGGSAGTCAAWSLDGQAPVVSVIAH